MRRAVISIGTDAPPEVLPKIIVHELGHALGLDHDEQTDSVMMQGPGGLTITDLDRALLGDVYR